MWIKSYGVSIQRNFAQHYSLGWGIWQKKFDFFVNFVPWLLLGMKGLSMYVCGVAFYNQWSSSKKDIFELESLDIKFVLS